MACSHVKVLRRVEDGWHNGCLGSDPFGAIMTKDQCKEDCYKDPSCKVWHFSAEGCWRSDDPFSCKFRGNTLAGERIIHGNVRVIKPLRNLFCEGLQKHIFQLSDINDDPVSQDSVAARCRDMCYSKIDCTAWQYSDFGCNWGNIANCNGVHISWDGLMTGEQIEHYCPMEEPWWKHLWHYWLAFLLVLFILALLCSVIEYLLFGRLRVPKKRSTRAVKGPDFKEQKELVSSQRPEYEPLDPLSLQRPEYEPLVRNLDLSRPVVAEMMEGQPCQAVEVNGELRLV